MIVETLSALGAISLGASLGIYFVASEATLDSLKPWKKRGGWRSGRATSSVVLGGVPWRTADGLPEAFCGLCDQALEGAETARSGSSDARVTLRCRPCGLVYPLTEGMTWQEVVTVARQRLSMALVEPSTAN